jgi:hypothetical protein
MSSLNVHISTRNDLKRIRKDGKFRLNASTLLKVRFYATTHKHIKLKYKQKCQKMFHKWNENLLHFLARHIPYFCVSSLYLLTYFFFVIMEAEKRQLSHTHTHSWLHTLRICIQNRSKKKQIHSAIFPL